MARIDELCGLHLGASSINYSGGRKHWWHALMATATAQCSDHNGNPRALTLVLDLWGLVRSDSRAVLTVIFFFILVFDKYRMTARFVPLHENTKSNPPCLPGPSFVWWILLGLVKVIRIDVRDATNPGHTYWFAYHIFRHVLYYYH